MAVTKLVSKQFVAKVHGNETVNREVEGRVRLRLVADPKAVEAMGAEAVEEVLAGFNPYRDVAVDRETGELRFETWANPDIPRKYIDLFTLLTSNYEVEPTDGEVNVVQAQFERVLFDIKPA